MPDHPAVELLRDWLNRGQSGCKFASQLASGDPRLGLLVHLGPAATASLDEFDSHCDNATLCENISLFVFPRMSSEHEVVELVRHLQTSSRWTVDSLRHPSDSSILGLSVKYQTKSGAYSSVMGFAPSGKMPVSRRAPYTMLALWAGEHENEFFRHGPRGLVGLADVPTGLSRRSYDKTWASSVEGTKMRLQDPAHDSVWLRGVAFCLARELVEPHWPIR